MSKIVNQFQDLIGNTPLFRLQNLERRNNLSAKLLAKLAQGPMRSHHTRHRVAIGNADTVQPQRDCLRNHRFRRTRAVEKGVMRRRDQFGEASHANRPCTYQRGRSVSL